ncbi:hypothetical protein GGF32_002548 [Allomyces javanicus]|nr:hypothetical protein GGF32_002548 [Allomyces javanicus]
MPPSPPPAAAALARRAITLYFDPADAKVQTRYGWAGKYNPGHCFLCTACLARETAAYPCPRMAKGRTCPIAGARFNKTRSSVERVCLATTGDRCRALLAESPHWAAAKAHACKTLGENGAFGIVLCKRFCLKRWRTAATEDEGQDDAADNDGNKGSIPRRLPPSSPSRPVLLREPAKQALPADSPSAPHHHRRRARDADDLSPSAKRIRTDPRPHSTPPPPPSSAASSPWMALALGHMQLQATMLSTERLRARLAARERMHALGYTKEEMDRELNGPETSG